MIRRCYRYETVQRGFTLIEVLVAVLVVATGLLGLAKTQALSISNTQLSASRALVALQASSLAAAMQGNPAYWAAGVASPSFSAQGSSVSDPSGVLDQTNIPNCATAAAPACTPVQLAAYDVQSWAANMALQLPSYAASFSCTAVAGTQISCSITLNWSEKAVALNASTAIGAGQTSTQSYTLYVAP